ILPYRAPYQSRPSGKFCPCRSASTYWPAQVSRAIGIKWRDFSLPVPLRRHLPERPAAQPPLHKTHQVSLFSQIVDETPSLIGPPVHAFRLFAELLHHFRPSPPPPPRLFLFSTP